MVATTGIDFNMNTVMAANYPPISGVVTVGIDPYMDNTAGLVDSVDRFQPNAELVIVNNASGDNGYFKPWRNIYHLTARTSYAAALNIGMQHISADWIVTMNNDVLCVDEYEHILNRLPPGVYAPVMMDAGTHGFERPWLDGWVQVIHRQVYEAIGGFDERFLMAGFEDADYCWRAEEAGFPYRAIALPFLHKDAHTRYGMPGYAAQREANIEYLRAKWTK